MDNKELNLTEITLEEALLNTPGCLKSVVTKSKIKEVK